MDNAPIRNLNRDEYERRKGEQARREKREVQNKERALEGLPPLEDVYQKPRDHVEPKEFLTARTTRLKLDATLGKTQVVESGSSNRQPGFYCPDCDCTLKDSVSYVDHINGKKHQISAGIILKVERSTLSQVQRKLEEMKQRKNAPKTYDLDERVALAVKKEEEERELKRQRRLEKKLSKKSKLEEDEREKGLVDDDAAKIMGFGSFGNPKK
ncbi:U4/U6.U5 snRNP associated protein [Entomophthora muscae]|uniref:U4/U6.U5 snRNP associated protein n=1 Tax=Entomophthora muscae TaxID=34485 RepID=A0ACC2RJG5_9FUNG|nr:U4/U6.U5 snRNP associated protein [Entomophthora muscae]